MSNTTPVEKAIKTREVVIFYKCPVGGYASLRPGLCPKCREPLTPLFVPPLASARDGNEFHGRV